ncbi:MAG: DNA-binding protein [Clostridiales bacterium]|nr:DNA-binding protein [Clostridiales bacterium]MBR0468334.1 HIRAN domain-containing protein [Mogibacterium sp.]
MIKMDIYFTITGTSFYYGKDFFEKGMTVKLIKEPDNPFDREAIKVELEGLGLVGYVANSVGTTIGESYSAGRIYDKIGDKAEGKVLYVVDRGVLCVMEA